jgi:sugar phosphate isomerase/epimerase
LQVGVYLHTSGSIRRRPQVSPQQSRFTGSGLSFIVGVGAIAPRQMVDESDHDRLEKQFRERIEMAKQLNCKRLVGLTGNERKDISRDEQKANVIKFLKRMHLSQK